MKEFPMCPDCAEEYHDPETRRYDAQPVCCNDCGPEVYLIGRKNVAETQLLIQERQFRRRNCGNQGNRWFSSLL